MCYCVIVVCVYYKSELLLGWAPAGVQKCYKRPVVLCYWQYFDDFGDFYFIFLIQFFPAQVWHHFPSRWCCLPQPVCIRFMFFFRFWCLWSNWSTNYVRNVPIRLQKVCILCGCALAYLSANSETFVFCSMSGSRQGSMRLTSKVHVYESARRHYRMRGHFQVDQSDGGFEYKMDRLYFRSWSAGSLRLNEVLRAFRLYAC